MYIKKHAKKSYSNSTTGIDRCMQKNILQKLVQTTFVYICVCSSCLQRLAQTTCTYLFLFQYETYLAISVKPQEAVACKGVQPSLSQTSTSAECWTINSTISKLSSIHAYKQTRNVTQICHFRFILKFNDIFLFSFIFL